MFALWILLGGLWNLIFLTEGMITLILRFFILPGKIKELEPISLDWILEKKGPGPFSGEAEPQGGLDDPLKRLLSWFHRCFYLQRIEMKPGKNRILLQQDKNRGFLPDPHCTLRGFFSTRRGWEMETPFRMFRLIVQTDDTISLWVYPSREDFSAEERFNPAGHMVRKQKSFESSREFYENRKYVPGDDPRKILWKHYARTGDLHIRMEEQSIPRGQEWFYCLDPRHKEPMLTRQLSRLRGLIEGVHSQQEECFLWVPPLNKWINPAENPRLYRKGLALWSVEDSPLPDQPPRGTLIFFSYHGSDNIPAQQDRKSFSSLQIIEDPLIPENRGPFWKGILFRRGR